jgi:hypothetical protein
MSNFICFNLENFQNTNVINSVSESTILNNEATSNFNLSGDQLIGKNIDISTSLKTGNLDCSLDRSTMSLEIKKVCFPNEYKTGVNPDDLKNEITQMRLDMAKQYSNVKNNKSSNLNPSSSSLSSSSSSESESNNKPSSNFTIYLVIIILIIIVIGGGGYYYFSLRK